MHGLKAVFAVCLVMSAGILVAAQEPPIDELPAWQITTNRQIIWIGEDLVCHVNGPGNATFWVELRPTVITNESANNTVPGKYGQTNATGNATVTFTFYETAQEGNYLAVVLWQNILVASKAITINYDPQRYNRIEDQRIMDYIESEIQPWIDQFVLNFRYVIQRDEDTRNWLYFNIALCLVIIFAQLDPWYKRYRAHRDKRGKASRLHRILQKSDDRRLYYGGGTIDPEPSLIPPKNRDNDLTTHGIAGMTNDQANKYINKRAKDMGYKAPPGPPAVEKQKWFHKKKEAKK